MKNSDFLKQHFIANKGLYDNKIVFENTLESFRAAIIKNYAIHFSVQCTKDKVLVIYHDDDLTRIMNLKDKISSTTYEELNYICSYHIPTLEEALKVINGEVPIIINPRTYDNKYYLEKELVKILDEYQGLFAIISAEALVIKWFNNNRSNYLIGEIVTKTKRFNRNIIKNLFAHYSIITDFKSVNVDYLDIFKIKQMKETALILGFLINSQEKYELFKDACDNLFLDNIDQLDI